MRSLFFFLFLTVSVNAQIGMGQWRMHVPNRTALDLVVQGNTVFAAYENGLLEYDIEANETSLWTDVNSLSDIDLTCLGNYTPQNALYIGYENGNIDKIVNNQVTNIPAIRLAQVQGNKRINRIVPYQGFVYFATSFSIVKIDPVKNEVRETFYPTVEGSAVYDIAFKGDTIYALTSTKMLRANINNNALGDPAQWTTDTRLQELTANSYKDIEIIDDNIYVLFKGDGYGSDTVYNVKSSLTELVTDEPFTIEINSLNTSNNRLVVNSEGTIYFYNSDYTKYKMISSFILGQWISPLNCFTANNVTWFADNTKGLVKEVDEFNITRITFDGPPKSSFYSMDWFDGKLAIAGGGLSSVFATFNNAGMYVFEDEKWDLYDTENMTLWNGQNVWDFLSVSIDPTNSERMAVGSYSEIPLSIIDNGVQVTDTFTPNNSTLRYTQGGVGWSLVSSVQYDGDGNLWALNGYTDEPLNVLTKDGNWYSFDLGSSAKNKFTKRIVVDYVGNKWFSIEGVGLVGYNDNGTISNAADDKIRSLNSGEQSGALPSNSVTAIAVDFDNEIWIGTDNGFAVLYNSESSFDAGPGDYNASRIKLEYEGNVEYVLGNTHITDIEVDGANRKWFATANSGIILLSADGLEIIRQFTVENSPLISNNIIDLKIDHKTGELFIITDKGLVSYRSDATYEDPDYANVVVFPNPAHPDFEGPITIQGIRYDSDVKITDIAGNLVYQTTSNGGTATWNGKTINGEKVVTGVYLIWTAANEGKGRKVGKVLVVH
jgi:hypothetical protein